MLARSSRLAIPDKFKGLLVSQQVTNGSHHLQTPNPAEKSIDLFGLVWRRKGWIAASTVIGIMLAWLYCSVTPMQYESTTQILVMKKDTNLPINSSAASSGSVDARVAEDILATHTQILLSPHNIGRALDRIGLRSLPVLAESVGPNETTEEHLIEQIEVTRGGEGHATDAHVLNLQLVHGDAIECEKILSAIVEAYQDYIKEKFQDSSGEALNLITRAREELSVELAKKEEAYRRFRQEASLLFHGSEVTNSHQTNLIEIERSISANRLRHAQVKSRHETVSAALADQRTSQLSDLERMALIDAADIERLTLLVSVQRADPISESFQAAQPMREEKANVEFDRLVSLKLERQERLQQVGEGHPRVKQLDESIRELSQFLKQRKEDVESVSNADGVDIPQLMETYERLLRLDLDELTRRHDELISMADAERTKAKRLVNDELLADSMRRERDRTQALYDTVIDRLSEVSLIRDYGGLITEVIEPISAGRDHWPKIPVVLVLGAFMGMFLGLTSALGAELIDSAFRSPDDIEETLGLDVLTHVPNVSTVVRRVKRTCSKNGDASGVAPEVVLHHAPSSVEAESVRGLRAQLMLHLQGTDKKNIMITSPTLGDGKSWLSANLAVSMAHAGNRVLLIDGDLRNPRLHQLFATHSEIGLTTVLSDKCEIADAIQSTACSRLSLMPSGSLPNDPGEMLGDSKMAELIESLREQFDYLLFDCPPVLPVSDSLLIATHCDACVLQLRLHRHTRANAIRTRDLLRSSGVPLLGACVFGAESNRSYNVGKLDQLGYGYTNYANRTHSDRSSEHERSMAKSQA